ncbi:MAG: hypothetical protein LBQ19_06015 [Synergistaceae bacterium]|nr:hypothetical protein [Synergistaceae bacterium]
MLIATGAAITVRYSRYDDSDVRRTELFFERSKNSYPKLIAFLHKMPKGGDLHNHPSGALDAEDVIALAIEQGLYYDRDAERFTKELPSRDYWAPGDYFDPRYTQVNPAYSDVLNALSQRDVGSDNFAASTQGENVSGHDDFFRVFNAVGDVDIPLELELRRLFERASGENIGYMELMDTPASAEDLAKYDKLRDEIAPGLRYNFIATVVRTVDLERFKKMLDDAVAKYYDKDLRVVGITILAPEDNPISRRDFDAQMQAIDELYQKSVEEHPDDPPKFSLHSGELTLKLSPYMDMTDRISESIYRGHSIRIDHGASIQWENDVYGLLRRMKDEHIGVTVCLTSNQGILNYDAFTSQFRIYYDAGVTVSLSTDDEGVSRTNLTAEYAKAVTDFGLSYADIKGLAYNAIDIALLDEDAKSAERSKLDVAFDEFEAKITEASKIF